MILKCEIQVSIKPGSSLEDSLIVIVEWHIQILLRL